MGANEGSTSSDVESPHGVCDSEVMTEQIAHDADTPRQGSSVPATIFNFTNCIIGAGAIGLGGAFAASGGLVSVVALISFGLLTKISLDMIISLSVDTEGAHNSYEELAMIAYGRVGWTSVILSKTLYSFGCLVAYIVVVKDNFASALLHLFLVSAESPSKSQLTRLLEQDNVVTLCLSVFVIFPLCLLRDMSSLSNLSFVSVVSMVFIVVIVLYLYLVNPGGDIRQPGGGVYSEWLEVRPGFVESLGTFVFTFVSQHTVHLTYESLHPGIRTVATWKKVSFYSILISTTVSLSIGLVVYMTFWEHTRSDLFEMYPPLRAIDISKLLLCLTMLLTFPLPFFTTRDMIVLCLVSMLNRGATDDSATAGTEPDESARDELQEPLLTDDDATNGEETSDAPEPSSQSTWLLPDHERQLKLPYHVSITFVLWSLTIFLAIMAPSLGDVLNLVGCATGTVIAFILPSLFSFRLRGYSHMAALVLVVGGVVGSLGTYQSVGKLIADV